jgi:aldose 1-epimerase
MTDTYTLPIAEHFRCDIDGIPVDLYHISSRDNSCSCAITNYGARIVSLIVPDTCNIPTDVVLGYRSIDDYRQQPEDYMGAVVGRCANRIAAGLFVLNGQTCILPVNDGPNTLHGGLKGLHARVWRVQKATKQMLVLTYQSPDGEEGFPGNLDIEIAYEWIDDNTLQMRYRASTDKTTLVNLSNHSYFNLSGEGSETVLDHELVLNADFFTPVNAALIPNGELQPVGGTAFDFRGAHLIGERINTKDEQLDIGRGYDHNFVLRNGPAAVEMSSPKNGIRMKLVTDRPGLQFYSGNFLDGTRMGKAGKPYGFRSAVALEPQGFPDAIHHPQFPSVVLKPGEVYYSVSEYCFSKLDKDAT